MITPKESRAPTRYRENLTARLRRQSSVNNSTTSLRSSRRPSPVASRRSALPSRESSRTRDGARAAKSCTKHLLFDTYSKTDNSSLCSTPGTPLSNSRSVTPRGPSPEPGTRVTTMDNHKTQEQSKGTELSQRAQELLSDFSNVSNQSSSTYVHLSRKPNDASKTNKSENYKSDLIERNICKTYVMVKSHKEGYGRPLLKTVNKKLIIHPYPIPPYRVSPHTGSHGASSSSTRSASRIDTSTKPASTKLSPNSPNTVQQPCTSNDSQNNSNYTPLPDIESSYYILKQKPALKLEADDASTTGSIPQTSERKDRTREAIIQARIRFLRKTQQFEADIKENGIPQKPQPLREDMRQMMIRESKRKYLSKQYQSQSKFEKIEGLNWISWPQ
ncbi:uncharacterized protein LOC125233187 [Leguminivora glycinivorella]|uniref:uncharacterized protein LOC125233187 n=1 Tax=Leguminivora glycinivorella TaxID=1035111 RepID=UPI00200C3172|nr:uncharacterized protein LOC125233187 [Leguminivora glycinivorella]